MDVPAPLPDLVLWRGDGCHLCDDALVMVGALLAERTAAGRPAPRLVTRRIAEDPAVHRALFELIPVLEIDGRRLPLAIRIGPVRAFLAAVLDGQPSGGGRPGSAGAPGSAGFAGARAPTVQLPVPE